MGESGDFQSARLPPSLNVVLTDFTMIQPTRFRSGEGLPNATRIRFRWSRNSVSSSDTLKTAIYALSFSSRVTWSASCTRSSSSSDANTLCSPLVLELTVLVRVAPASDSLPLRISSSHSIA